MHIECLTGCNIPTQTTVQTELKVVRNNEPDHKSVYAPLKSLFNPTFIRPRVSEAYLALPASTKYVHGRSFTNNDQEVDMIGMIRKVTSLLYTVMWAALEFVARVWFPRQVKTHVWESDMNKRLKKAFIVGSGMKIGGFLGLEVGWGNGYVGVPSGHPWYGCHYEDIDLQLQRPIHGGLTYSEWGKPGGEDRGWYSYWWVGFDTAHYGDDLKRCPYEYVVNETEELRLQAEASWHIKVESNND